MKTLRTLLTCCILMVTAQMMPVMAEVQEIHATNAYLKGDLNLDNVVDVADVDVIWGIMRGNARLYVPAGSADVDVIWGIMTGDLYTDDGDVNEDGTVDVGDIEAIYEIMSGISSPDGNPNGKAVLSADPVTIAQGETAQLKVYINYASTNKVTGWNFSLYLPDGVTIDSADVKKDYYGNWKILYSYEVDNTFYGTNAQNYTTINPKNDGGYLVAYNRGKAIPDTHGIIITLTLKATANVKGTGYIKGIALSDRNAESLDLGNIADAKFDINGGQKTPLTITCDNATKTYGADNPTLTVTYSGFVNGDTEASLTQKPTVTTTATKNSPVGTYPITATGAVSDKYEITYVPGTLTVNKAALTITADDKTKVQGEDNPALTVSYKGFVNGDDASKLTRQPTVTTTATKSSPAGTYPITVSNAASNNYNIAYVNGTLTVTAVSSNYIYLENTEVKSGSEAMLSFKMRNTAAIRGFQFNLYLPDGVTAVKSAKGKIQASLSSGRLPDEDEHTLAVQEQADGSLLFLCGSQYDETFTGNDGEILTLNVNVAEDMADGDYPVYLKNIKLTETDISRYYETAEKNATLTVTSYMLGDINNDQKVDVSDYIGVANRILGITQQTFIEKAGDVDENGRIDVSDYIGVANLILTGNIYGTTETHEGAINDWDILSSRSMKRTNTDVSGIDNVLYVEPLQAKAGDQVQLSLKMKNTAPIRGFQFNLCLPEGVTVAKSAKGKVLAQLTADRLPDEDEHTLAAQEQADGSVLFLCGSQYDECFTGNDGEIATVTLDISAGISNGDYPVLLKNIKLTETDISKYYETAEVETTLTIGGKNGDKWGDVNNDGIVDVADIATIISIMASQARLQMEMEEE